VPSPAAAPAGFWAWLTQKLSCFSITPARDHSDAPRGGASAKTGRTAAAAVPVSPRADAHEVMQYMRHVQQSSLDPDDPLTSYMLQVGGCLPLDLVKVLSCNCWQGYLLAGSMCAITHSTSGAK
jgi:hypothetical protein